jgi:hypothetical protein
MHSLQIALLCMSLFFFPLSPSHHVVFEVIGKMAGALSYIHVIVPVNISRLAHAIKNFGHNVQALQKLYTEKRQLTGSNNDDWFHQQIVDLFQLASADAESMLAKMDSLRDTLPPVASQTHLPHKEHEYQI